MTRERCPVCDVPMATGWEEIKLDFVTLCFASFNGGQHTDPPVDWRARALAAEAKLANLEDVR